MVRLVSAFLAVVLVGAIADAKTPLRKCRAACKPLVSSTCPAKGKPLRKCRTAILRECRRDGVAACAFGLPTGGPGDDTTTPTTMPGQSTTSTSVTTTTAPGATTTTLAPADVPSVAGNWTFQGTMVQPGCNLNADTYHQISSALVVQQDGQALSGTMEGHAAAGAASASGWSFEWKVGDGAPCTQRFVVDATGVSSPAAAEGVASATCNDGSSCQARWTGSVTRDQ